MGRVTWAGDGLVMFTPGTEFDDRSILFGVGEVGEAEVGVGFECERGGEGKGVYVESVSVEIGWAG